MGAHAQGQLHLAQSGNIQQNGPAEWSSRPADDEAIDIGSIEVADMLMGLAAGRLAPALRVAWLQH